MRHLVLAGLCTAGLALTGLAIGFTVGGGTSFVGMDFLNMTVQALAEREDVPYSALRVGWTAQAGVWLSPHLGADAFWLRSSGAIRGREAMEISATAFGVEVQIQTSLRQWGLPFGTTLSVGLCGCWASASGLVVGQGFGWGGTVRAAFPLFRAGPLGAEARVSLRYLPVRTIRDGERIIDTGGLPVIDFSGVGVGLMATWGP